MVPPLLYARALAMVVAARTLLRRRGTTQALRRLSGSASRSKRVDPLHALKAVQRASRLTGGACLPQAVALTVLLQRGGHEPVLVLGSHRDTARRWSAHAWVEVDRMVLEPVVTVEHRSLAHVKAANGWVPSPPKGNL